MIRALLFAAGLPLLAFSQTWTRDVAPILFEHCASCHRPGEAAPFSLLEYSDARARAKQIAEVTRTRYMPPWKPAAGRGDFEGSHRLTDEQIRTLAAWASSGGAEGDRSELPAKPVFASGWQLGEPDLIVTAERPYVLPAQGQDVFRNLVLKPSLKRTRYVRAVEIRPGPKTVVHHANVLVDRQRSLRRRDNEDGAPGFPGMDVQVESRTFEPESHFLFWKPGTTALEEPAGMSWRIDPGTDLILNMHLVPSGKPETIRPSIALYFTDQPPVSQPMLMQLEADGALNIPAGESNFIVEESFRLPVALEVLGVYPHAHYLGKDVQAYATLPNGARTWLIHIPDWDLNWQAVYRYRRPVKLPSRSVITMRYTYDNSSANVRNPNRPPAVVKAGDRSTDEMAHLWLQVLTAPEERVPLQTATLQHRLQKNPADFAAHFSLGALLQTEGKLEAAIQRYRTALKLNPRSATAQNALGAALLESGAEQGALAAFKAAIQFDANYGDAHYNLARLWLSRGEFPAAIRHLREMIRIDPGDAPALSDLGAALCVTGQRADGFRYLQEAVAAQPDNYNAQFNLAQALLSEGKTKDAAVHFREALRVKPGDGDAARALKQIAAH